MSAASAIQNDIEYSGDACAPSATYGQSGRVTIQRASATAA